jgi:hypothetical protein
MRVEIQVQFLTSVVALLQRRLEIDELQAGRRAVTMCEIPEELGIESGPVQPSLLLKLIEQESADGW